MRRLLKRCLDLTGSLLLLVLLAPVLLIVALAVRLDSRGPILFRQARLGLGGKVFTILKFRTLAADPCRGGATLRRDDPRITAVGRVLREYRLDELPQLLNVVLGHMSLVGPRPLLPRFLPYYTPHDRRRLDVLPGMTGWQQVNGAGRNTWRERVALDVWYVDHAGLLLDLRILLRTVRVVFLDRTAYAPDGSQISGIPDATPLDERNDP